MAAPKKALKSKPTRKQVKSELVQIVERLEEKITTVNKMLEKYDKTGNGQDEITMELRNISMMRGSLDMKIGDTILLLNRNFRNISVIKLKQTRQETMTSEERRADDLAALGYKP